jgi:hypothetical protein
MPASAETGLAFGARQASLEVADDRAKQTRCEKARAKRTGPILTDWRKLPQSSLGLHGHAAELPVDLVANSIWTVRRGQSHGLGGVCRGAQGMRTHVRGCCGLPCCSGGSGRCSAAHLTCGGAAGEPAADLFSDVKLAAPERLCSRDRIAWAGIAWSLRLEQSEHTLRAASCPHGNGSSFGFAQRLW